MFIREFSWEMEDDLRAGGCLGYAFNAVFIVKDLSGILILLGRNLVVVMEGNIVYPLLPTRIHLWRAFARGSRQDGVHDLLRIMEPHLFKTTNLLNT